LVVFIFLDTKEPKKKYCEWRPGPWNRNFEWEKRRNKEQ